MPGFVTVPYNFDERAIAAEALAYVMSRIPGWVPADADLETVLITALSHIAAKHNFIVSNVPAAAFYQFGTTVMGIPVESAAKAAATSTWVMNDTQGYTIPAGTVVAYPAAGDQLVPFVVQNTVTVAPGQNTTAANEVILQALVEGSSSNGLAAGPLSLVDALNYVASVNATSPSGGADQELFNDYINRVSEELTLLTPTPILPPEYAILAKKIAGVHRAVGIGEYNPQDGTLNNPRMVTVVMVDDTGQGVGAGVKADVKAYLESLREVNFIVNVADPTYFNVQVLFDVKSRLGFDTATVKAAIQSALATYFDPNLWGSDPAQSTPSWLNTATVIRLYEVAQVINNVDGVDYIRSLSVNNLTTDIPLPIIATLTTLTLADGTVS